MATKTHYIDPTGERVAAKYVPAYDKLRDRVAWQIAKDWQKMEAQLAALKDKTRERIEKLQEASAKAANVPNLGGAKGNLQFRSFNGDVTVSLDCQRRSEFDERILFAQQLITEAVQEMSRDATNADLVEIATRAFQPRRSGSLDMQRIRDLRNYNVKHAKWVQAIHIINDCERTIGHREYIRVTVRKAADKKPEPIVLDIAAV